MFLLKEQKMVPFPVQSMSNIQQVDPKEKIISDSHVQSSPLKQPPMKTINNRRLSIGDVLRQKQSHEIGVDNPCLTMLPATVHVTGGDISKTPPHKLV